MRAVCDYADADTAHKMRHGATALPRNNETNAPPGTVPPFNRLLRGNDVVGVAINPQRHVSRSELFFRFRGIADMARIAARSTP